MTFKEAIALAVGGKYITRLAWNGEGVIVRPDSGNSHNPFPGIAAVYLDGTPVDILDTLENDWVVVDQ